MFVGSQGIHRFRSLQHVGAVTQQEGQLFGPPTVCNFNQTYGPDTIKHLHLIELVHSVGYLHNLATAEPGDFILMKDVITHKTTPPSTGRYIPASHFFLVGSVRHSALTGSGSRQICLSISDRTFPRAIAVLGSILHQEVLYVPTFWQGVTFGSFRAPRTCAIVLVLVCSDTRHS